jgi:hypothetical protein
MLSDAMNEDDIALWLTLRIPLPNELGTAIGGGLGAGNADDQTISSGWGAWMLSS